ncbi:Na(+)/H(+) antiporter [Dictyocoela roeselum]|nr:Na(+)/H(+) antiporter [Dictyocoela roeselum]
MSPSIIFASILIIFLRRTIPVYIFKKWIPEIKNVKEAIFIGWFGPIGVGALFYALMADKILNTITIEYVSVVVLFSVIIHGLTIPLFKLSSVQNEPKMTGFHLPRRIYTAEVEDSVSFLG